MDTQKLSNIITSYLLLVFYGLGVILFILCPISMLVLLGLAIVWYVLDPWDRETIKIKYFDDEIQKIEKIKVGDWIDLRSADTVRISAGEYKLIRLGVGMILPKGYEAHVLPRSSTPSKFGIIMANSMGVIDNSYAGDEDEWRFPAVAIQDTLIIKGDRIAQFRIVRNQPRIKFEIVEHLKAISRGGIGSTGKA